MSKKKSPYPHRGTPRGDEAVGPCAGCASILRRGDSFVTLLGDILLCTPCNHSGVLPREGKEVAMK
jgi:hypothetical protein